MLLSPRAFANYDLKNILKLLPLVIIVALFAFTGKKNSDVPEGPLNKGTIDTLPLNPDALAYFYYSAPHNLILKTDTMIMRRDNDNMAPEVGKALVIINGKTSDPGIITQKTIVSKELILYSGKEAIKRYGKAAEKGVFEFNGATIIDIPPAIYYKQDLPVHITPAPETDDKIFVKTEFSPAFPGGEKKWEQYVKDNLDQTIPAIEGAPSGDYSVIVRMVIDAKGKATDFKALTNHGYGMEEEAISVVRKVPDWKPAVQNGREVKSYYEVKVTFAGVKEKPAGRKDDVHEISKEKLQNISVQELLKTSEDKKIISFVFTIDLPDGGIAETTNEGSVFNSKTQLLLKNAQKGNLITIEKIRVSLNGVERTIPARVYRVTD
jgi:hypothetical protein